MTNVWIVASEAVPFAKTGGLGDVAGALSSWLPETGISPTLVLPLYRGIREAWPLGAPLATFEVPVGRELVSATVYPLAEAEREVLFIEQDRFYDREGLYGFAGERDFPDNAARFIFLARSVLQLAERSPRRPDVIHCHDWQTGLIPFYLRTVYSAILPRLATVFSIHNLGYQGVFGPEHYGLLGVGREYFHMDALEFWGNVCFLKAGILFADRVTTVSPTYAEEILTPEYGFGLEGVLRTRKGELSGILNGIDTVLWNPETDKTLPRRFSAVDPAGRDTCRRGLRKMLGLDPRSARPLFGVVGRLAYQKGIDLISDGAEDILRLGGDLAILGEGDFILQGSLQHLADQYPHRISFSAGFDEKLARHIYAGSDAFLMPSRYEPCGLGQLIALRYGSLPVAARTGGLADTVRETGDRPNGFLFSGAVEENLLGAVARAVHLFKRGERWRERVTNGMRDDHSWSRTVGEYASLYETVAGERSGGV